MRDAMRACLALAVLLSLGAGCGESRTGFLPGGPDGGLDYAAGPGSDGSTGRQGDLGPGSTNPDAGHPPRDNVVPIVVDDGPTHDNIDVPFVSVTVCVPGTGTCATIDHLTLDTGSTGLRIAASTLPAGFDPPRATARDGNPLVECYQFADSYTWGSVRTVDVRMGDEVARGVKIQLIGDPGFPSVPGACSSSGPSANTVADLGSNGILGINQFIADCDTDCADPQDPAAGAYYSCGGSGCSATAVAVADQVSNPVASFAADNNGYSVQLDAVPATGARTAAGRLVFGIGTAADNALGSARVLTADDNGEIDTVYAGSDYSTSFIDSGTNTISFDDGSIPRCSGGDADGYDCPTSTLALSGRNTGRNGASSTLDFSVGNARTLFADTSLTAFDDVADSGIDGGTFDWGLPIFFGRTIYFGLEGASTPGGPGPYFAY